MISRSKVNGQHSIWKDTTVTTEGKNRSARWTELHAACHDILVVTYSLAVTWPYGQAEGNRKVSHQRDVPVGHSPMEIAMGI